MGWVAMGKKIRAIAFYYPSPEFNFKNILTQVFAHQKYHAQLKGEEKIIAPENCTPSPPLPPKKIMVRALLILITHLVIPP